MAKVFINDEIFQSDKDYVIGGFETDKITGFEYADFVDALKTRIEMLVSEFIERTILVEVQKGNDTPVEKAHLDLSQIIMDNLDSNPEFSDEDGLVMTIFNDIKVQSWLEEIKVRVKEVQPTKQGIKSMLANQSVQISELSTEYQNAKMWTNDTSLEQFIEEVSSIEL